MRFGVHVGIGKGFKATVAEALEKGCDTIQIFAGNPRAFRRTPYDAAAWDEFKALRKKHDIKPTVIHTSYLVNLVTSKKELQRLSTILVAHDLELASRAGIEYVNTHLGSYGTEDREAGFERVVATLKTLIASASAGPMLLLENSAGAGNACGGRIDELGEILRAVGSPRVGVCLDTAHSWASGYDIASQKGVDAFVREVKKHIGLKRVRALHTNDTRVELGAKRDLHWHIGEGNIGPSGFKAILTAPGFQHVAAICETPESSHDKKNVAAIRRFAGSGTAAPSKRVKAELSGAKGGRKRH
ncbi:MAG TPA: deoxyribonuclease IV [Candidatus Eremiobacteraceae bacterium]|nr:deoxyribonuclease IV [Candidatus Eremiobacteraceae bacterium]